MGDTHRIVNWCKQMGVCELSDARGYTPFSSKEELSRLKVGEHDRGSQRQNES